MYEFCRDQHGSRFIQQKLAEGPPEQLMEVYQEIQPHVIGLMQDVFGNYVIQKCFEHGNQVSITALGNSDIAPSVFARHSLCCCMLYLCVFPILFLFYWCVLSLCLPQSSSAGDMNVSLGHDEKSSCMSEDKRHTNSSLWYGELQSQVHGSSVQQQHMPSCQCSLSNTHTVAAGQGSGKCS